MLRREFVVGLGAFSLLGDHSFAQGVAAIKAMKVGEFIRRPRCHQADRS